MFRQSAGRGADYFVRDRPDPELLIRRVATRIRSRTERKDSQSPVRMNRTSRQAPIRTTGRTVRPRFRNIRMRHTRVVRPAHSCAQFGASGLAMHLNHRSRNTIYPETVETGSISVLPSSTPLVTVSEMSCRRIRCVSRAGYPPTSSIGSSRPDNTSCPSEDSDGRARMSGRTSIETNPANVPERS